MTVTAKQIAGLTREVRATFQALGRYGTALHEDRGVTASMRAVMEFLVENGPHTVPAVASSKGVSRQHIQKITDELIDADLAETRKNPKHRRSVLIALTPKGRRVFAAMTRREETAFAAIAAGFSGENVTAASHALRRLREIVNANIEKGDDE